MGVSMNYKHIIIPLDGSELAECVLSHLNVITSNSSGTSVELVRAVPLVELHYKAVVPIEPEEETKIMQSCVKDADNYLGTIKNKLITSGMNVTTKVLIGNVADVLIEYINKSGADLVILATHGRSGPSRWIWGSVADKLLHGVQVPIFLIRPQACTVKL